jgi:hypothetical protein
MVKLHKEVWQNFLIKAVSQKVCFANGYDDDDDESSIKFI